jgi:ketosteroid isomerase-like protein
MKSKLLSLALLMVALLAFPTSSRAAEVGRTNDEQQIRKIEREWIDAIVKRDASYLQKIEASDFTATDPDGKMFSKEGDIKNTTGGGPIFDHIQIVDLKVRFYGNTAIVNGNGRVKGHSKEKDVSGKYSWTDVFVKMNGEWKAVSGHVTAVAAEKK